MFEKFTAAEHRDFHQRYRGTYGYFTRKGQRILVKLSEVSERAVTFVDKYAVEYKLNADAEGDDTGFVFLPPKCEYYNTKVGQPYLVRRIAARQYSRGICSKNTSIDLFCGGAVRVDFPALHQLYDAKIPFTEALEALVRVAKTSAYAGVALSKQFAYWHQGRELKCFNQTIGSAVMDLDTKEMTVELFEPDLWRQEIVDVLRRNNLKGIVK